MLLTYWSFNHLVQLWW